MQRIILDTNVIVSALISASYPSKILYEIVFAKRVEVCISSEILEEYIEVLNRNKFDKFQHFKKNAEIVISKLTEISVLFHPLQRVKLIKDDSDNKFLELAQISKANFIITGNVLDFTFELFESTSIVNPKAFYENFQVGLDEQFP